MAAIGKGTPDQRIAHHARLWRKHDQQAIANKRDQQKQDAEWQARQQLRETIDTAKEH